jgi:hypothetical protein
MSVGVTISTQVCHVSRRDGKWSGVSCQFVSKKHGRSNQTLQAFTVTINIWCATTKYVLLTCIVYSGHVVQHTVTCSCIGLHMQVISSGYLLDDHNCIIHAITPYHVSHAKAGKFSVLSVKWSRPVLDTELLHRKHSVAPQCFDTVAPITDALFSRRVRLK